MFDIGWSEMAVIALVALVVLGPKELPNALRMVAKWVKQARRLAREFQGGIDQIVRDAELDEARKAVQSASSYNIGREIEKTVDPTGEVTRAIDPVVSDAAEVGPKPEPAAPPAAEPAGATGADSAEALPSATEPAGATGADPVEAAAPATEPAAKQPSV